MKLENKPQTSLIPKLLKGLVPQDQSSKTIPVDPKVGSKPLEPAELIQDAGSGYNADFVDPQQ